MKTLLGSGGLRTSPGQVGLCGEPNVSVHAAGRACEDTVKVFVCFLASSPICAQTGRTPCRPFTMQALDRVLEFLQYLIPATRGHGQASESPGPPTSLSNQPGTTGYLDGTLCADPEASINYYCTRAFFEWKNSVFRYFDPFKSVLPPLVSSSFCLFEWGNPPREPWCLACFRFFGWKQKSFSQQRPPFDLKAGAEKRGREFVALILGQDAARYFHFP